MDTIPDVLRVPSLLVKESSDSSEEDLPVDASNWSIKVYKRGIARHDVAKLLEGIKVTFKGELWLVEEIIAPEDIPAPCPRRWRSRLQKEVAELPADLRFNPLTSGATGATRRGKGFRPH
ncbi:hypothetical protein AMTRI_Chr06g172050 [Amborella trichopoda]